MSFFYFVVSVRCVVFVCVCMCACVYSNERVREIEKNCTCVCVYVCVCVCVCLIWNVQLLHYGVEPRRILEYNNNKRKQTKLHSIKKNRKMFIFPSFVYNLKKIMIGNVFYNHVR